MFQIFWLEVKVKELTGGWGGNELDGQIKEATTAKSQSNAKQNMISPVTHISATEEAALLLHVLT